mgnify:CR=1 FL=1
MVKIASDYKRCRIDNSVTPKESRLIESEKADTAEFLNEILSILPLIDIRVFQEPQKIGVSREAQPTNSASTIKDTIVVDAREEGFQRVFLGEDF